MSILQKIKFNYYHKIFSDLIDQQDSVKIKSELTKLIATNPKLSYQLIKVFLEKIMNLGVTSKLFNESYLFINSFLKQDCLIISNFLEFYFSRIKHEEIVFTNFIDEFTSIESKFHNKQAITFQNILEDSLAYQAVMDLQSSGIRVVNNEYSFFSTDRNFNFTHPNVVKCFILLLDDPYCVYKQIKSFHNQDQNLAREQMLNSNSASTHEESKNNKKIEILRKDWKTHTNSWSDQNMVSSFKGLIIKKRDLIDSPSETLSEIIFHLIQSQLKIPMNYELIEEYSSSLKIDDFESVEISNKEKKYIENYLKDFEIN